MSIAKEEIQTWVKRIRARHPLESRYLTSEQLEASLSGWLGLIEPLQIHEHQDQVRFLSLSVLLTSEQRRSKLVEGVLKRIMSNLDWEPKQRLDFVYKHLVGRRIAPNEEDFGPKFVPC